jgi:hypothetical protein
MKQVLSFSLVLAVGVALGRMFDGAPPRAEAGGGAGGGVEGCATQNGDVNADTFVNISDAIAMLGSLFNGEPPALAPLCGTGAPSGLPDTGQTACYGLVEGQGWVPVPCAEAACAGQDGSYATGCTSDGRFVLNDGGTPEDTSDDTVTDNCTGLMWQRDTADVNDDGQSTDQDFVPWCDALAYCENLSFAGHDDWRLPNVRELQSIVDYGLVVPSIDPVFGALSSGYWSSTSSAGNPGGAWLVYFEGGLDILDGKDFSRYVRAVRSGP